MPSSPIDWLDSQLSSGALMVLDGAVGSEIERRGVTMDEIAWCAPANISHPNIVRAMHEDYIRAGADIITTNTFAAARHVLEPANLGERVVEINRTAVRLAREARDRIAERPVCIAGSISSMPPLNAAMLPVDAAAASNYREQAGILAQSGVDLILCEMMMDLKNAALVVQAAVETGLPVWVGFSAKVHGDKQQTTLPLASDLRRIRDIPFDRLVRETLSIGGNAAGAMHTSVDFILSALRVVASNWNGPLFAYPESGIFEPPSWKLVGVISPEAFARKAREWIAAGAQIVGGCCGIGPDHIRALRTELSTGAPRSLGADLSAGF